MEQKILKEKYQITLLPTLHGHYYKVKGMKTILPSSTTILEGAYPQSPFLTKWLQEQGVHESKRILNEASSRGTAVHVAISLMIQGKTIYKENYSLEEWFCIDSFVRWHQEYQPQIVASEIKIFSKKYKYAGTADLIVKFANGLYVLDTKTSSNIYPQFNKQIASYAYALEEMYGIKIVQTGILQLGTTRNKNGFKYVLNLEWHDHFKEFLNVKKVWDTEIASEPKILDELPNTLKI